jgi:hypothetical protein
MINIRHSRLHEFAELHCNSVVKYFEKHSQKQFRDFLKEADVWIQNNIEGFTFRKVILASPEELELIAGLFESLVDKFDFSRVVNLYEHKFSLKDSNLGYDARQLIDDLEISVCPYCNRNFIYNTHKKRPSEIDHFYAKDTFPILAMSFFNLIPSCKVCNQFKNNSSLPLINPYDSRYDWCELAKFRLKVNAADFYFSPESIELLLENKAKDEKPKTAVENAVKVFELKDQYDHHRDFVIELIQKKYLYSDDYLNALFKQYEGTLFKNREDLLRLVTANFVDDKDLKNRPLSKLTKDISEQLDL